MIDWDWFDQDDEDDLTPAQRSFLAALRARTGTWTCLPEHTELAEPYSECPYWRAVLDVPAQIEKGILLTVGVCLDGPRVWGCELHNQSLIPYPAHQSRVEFINAVGAPAHLAAVTAAWFERILSRPIERREWIRQDDTAIEYAFSDTGTALSHGGRPFPGAFHRPPDRVTPARGIHRDPGGIVHVKEQRSINGLDNGSWRS